MRSYEELISLTGAKNVEAFAGKLKDMGIKFHDSQVYNMARDCNNDPGLIKNYGADFRAIIPETIAAMSTWEKDITSKFMEGPHDDSYSPPTTRSATVEPAQPVLKAVAEQMLLKLLHEVGESVILRPGAGNSDPLAFYGMASILQLDPSGFTMKQAIIALTENN